MVARVEEREVKADKDPLLDVVASKDAEEEEENQPSEIQGYSTMLLHS